VELEESSTLFIVFRLQKRCCCCCCLSTIPLDCCGGGGDFRRDDLQRIAAGGEFQAYLLPKTSMYYSMGAWEALGVYTINEAGGQFPQSRSRKLKASSENVTENKL
jgi:hypothetical protein